jgi:hypothetical protein
LTFLLADLRDVGPYYTRQEVELAAALLLHKLGLQEKFAELRKKLKMSSIVESAPLTASLGFKDEEGVEEATGIFNSPDDPGMGVQVQASEFR